MSAGAVRTFPAALCYGTPEHPIREDTALICNSLDSIMLHVGDAVDWRTHLAQGLGNPLWETFLVVGQLLHAWPCLRRGRAQQAEDLEDLIDLLHRSRGTSRVVAHILE